MLNRYVNNYLLETFEISQIDGVAILIKMSFWEVKMVYDDLCIVFIYTQNMDSTDFMKMCRNRPIFNIEATCILAQFSILCTFVELAKAQKH